MKKSFSLIEVLVFTTVLGLFFVAAISVTTFNLKNMKIQEHKILAARYAEEAVEWLKQEKEDDWSDFVTHTGPYCLNSNSLSWPISVSCSPSAYSLGTPAFFKRELSITGSGSPVDKVETTVTVSWQDMGTDLKVEIPTVFRILE